MIEWDVYSWLILVGARANSNSICMVFQKERKDEVKFEFVDRE